MPIFVADTFEPASGNNTFPVVADTNVSNGYKVKADIAARNTIDPRLLTAGALVGVVDLDGSGTFIIYEFLGGDPTSDSNWTISSCGKNLTQTTGQYACAENDQTTASGMASHAEGSLAQALDTACHAEGSNTIAGVGDGSAGAAHAEGTLTEASDSSCHAEGQGTSAGNGDGTAIAAHAEGSSTEAGGPAAHAEGNGSFAGGAASHAEGTNTTATGVSSHAEGNQTLATAAGSHAEGSFAQSLAAAAHAEGTSTVANAVSAHAEGNMTTAHGQASHAEGTNTQANGNFSHAEGDTSVASGQASHAGGTQCTASNTGDFAHGNQSNASGGFSFALGTQCTASADGTFVTGSNCTASAIFAMAQGTGASAIRPNQRALSNTQLPAQGAFQQSELVMSKTHAARNATTNLVLDPFAVEANKAYAVTADFLAVDTATPPTFSVRQILNVLILVNNTGVPAITASTVTLTQDPSAIGIAFAVVVAAGAVSFQAIVPLAGIGGSGVNVVCGLRFVEVLAG